jgi:hypothetical protein
VVDDLNDHGNVTCGRAGLEEDDWKYTVAVRLLAYDFHEHSVGRTPSNLDKTLEV